MTAWAAVVDAAGLRAAERRPDFETVTLDRAALAYVHLDDGTTRKKQVIVFPS